MNYQQCECDERDYFSFTLSKIRRELNKGGWENSIWWTLQIFKSQFKPETKSTFRESHFVGLRRGSGLLRFEVSTNLLNKIALLEKGPKKSGMDCIFDIVLVRRPYALIRKLFLAAADIISLSRRYDAPFLPFRRHLHLHIR